MRILHAISNLSPQAGGPPKACLGMARAVASRGHHVEIYTTNYDGASELDVPFDQPVDMNGVSVRFFPVHFPRFWETSFPLGRAFDRVVSTFDVVHLHSLYMYHDRAAGNACLANGTPYIVRPHGTLDPYIRKRRRGRKRIFELWFQNRVLEGAAALHYTSDDEQRLASPYARNRRGFVAPNGLDMTEFSDLPSEGKFRARYPEIGDRPIILFFGRLNFKKGLDLLVPAFARLRAGGKDAHLVIAGPDDGMLRPTRQWLIEAGVIDHTTFTGMIDTGNKLSALVDADVFALPSYSENFGIAVAEAMACHLPVVISDQVNIWHDVKSAEAGIVSTCDVEAVTRALHSMLEADDETRRRMGSNGRRLVENKYSWDVIAPTLETAYQKIHGDADGDVRDQA